MPTRARRNTADIVLQDARRETSGNGVAIVAMGSAGCQSSVRVEHEEPGLVSVSFSR